MPKKITTDASGTVISVEDIPERKAPLVPPKRDTGKKVASKVGRTYERRSRQESTNSPVELVACSECGLDVPKGRMAKHLREAHLQETIAKRKRDIKDIDRELGKLAPGFHRIRMEELKRERNILLKDLQDLQRIAEERLDTNS